MDTPTFKATIYYIHPELINQLNTTFKRKNFYHKIMTLPRKGYHNPDYRQKMNNLQQKLWNDVLLQLKDGSSPKLVLDFLKIFSSAISGEDSKRFI